MLRSKSWDLYLKLRSDEARIDKNIKISVFPYLEKLKYDTKKPQIGGNVTH